MAGVSWFVSREISNGRPDAEKVFNELSGVDFVFDPTCPTRARSLSVVEEQRMGVYNRNAAG